VNPESNIRRLKGMLPSMAPTHIEPMHDIDVGPMQDVSPAAGFDPFSGHADQANQEAVPVQRLRGGNSGNEAYDNMRRAARDAYEQRKQQLRRM
jgi:hypothetical protein